jgi:hypothetical protein
MFNRLIVHNAAVRYVRVRIEKVFGTGKRSDGLRCMRWLGLAKAGLQVRLTAIATTAAFCSRLMREPTPVAYATRPRQREHWQYCPSGQPHTIIPVHILPWHFAHGSHE